VISIDRDGHVRLSYGILCVGCLLTAECRRPLGLAANPATSRAVWRNSHSAAPTALTNFRTSAARATVQQTR